MTGKGGVAGICGWREEVDGEMVTVIEYRDVRVYCRDENSVTRLLKENTDMQILTGQRDRSGRIRKSIRDRRPPPVVDSMP